MKVTFPPKGSCLLLTLFQAPMASAACPSDGELLRFYLSKSKQVSVKRVDAPPSPLDPPTVHNPQKPKCRPRTYHLPQSGQFRLIAGFSSVTTAAGGDNSHLTFSEGNNRILVCGIHHHEPPPH